LLKSTLFGRFWVFPARSFGGDGEGFSAPTTVRGQRWATSKIPRPSAAAPDSADSDICILEKLRGSSATADESREQRLRVSRASSAESRAGLLPGRAR